MKNHKKDRKKFSVFLYVTIGLIIFWLAVGGFLFFQKKPASIYVYPENPKQGDTVFIRVKSDSSNVAGNLGNEKLIFYKNRNSSDWISFLGIDADQNPGDYKISVDTSNGEQLTNNIKVALADFSFFPAVASPGAKQTGITNKEAVDNITKKDNPSINKFLNNFTATPYFNSPFSFPLSSMKLGGLSFGKFISFAGYKMQHFGTDLAAPKNTDVYAVNDGKVVAALDLSNYGKTIIIDHGLDIFSMYLHLNEFKVAEGDMVKKGQLIGLSGDTGYVTGPHLHFSMRVDGQKVDPVNFINATQLPAL
jgi:murein DD-endopeptidase MepM/ murein hydrolase activator NlpD